MTVSRVRAAARSPKMENHQTKISTKIGEIIRSVQYIESNLLERMSMDTASELTLGKIIELVKTGKVITSEKKLAELEDILKKRNDLAHQFFKRQDFEKHCDNEKFLVDQCRYLEKFADHVEHFNNWLVNKKTRQQKAKK